MKRLVFAALLVGAAPVLAQTQSAAPASATNDQDRIICEKIRETGSRISTKKVCMTKLQWEEKRRRDRESLEDAQNRSLEPNSG
jgi:hypothetical protein